MKNLIRTIRSSNKDFRRGFTLPEVIVSMAIIVMVVFASTSLLVSIIRSNAENTHTLIAYGLAQEGLEAVRNIRDSDWLLGARFEGVIPGQMQAQPWGATFPTIPNDKFFYTVDFNRFDTNLDSVPAANLYLSVPWVLKDITVSGSRDEKDYGKGSNTALFTVKDGDDIKYTHDSQDGKPTLYHRYISVEALPYSTSAGAPPSEKFVKMRVTSVVSWKEQVRDREVRLVTELTDWKP